MGTLLLMLQSSFPPPPTPPPPGLAVDGWGYLMLFIGALVYLLKHKRRKI